MSSEAPNANLLPSDIKAPMPARPNWMSCCGLAADGLKPRGVVASERGTWWGTG